MIPRRARIASRALALAFIVLAPRAGRAASPDEWSTSIEGIRIELRGCSGVDRAELEKLLAIEFRTLNVQPQGDSERVAVTCGLEHAELAFAPSGTSRTVELSGIAPGAWPRLLALAVSELVMDARARTPAAGPVAAPAASPVAAPAEKPPAVTPVVAKRLAAIFRIFAGARGQWVPSAPAMLWGPEIGVAASPFSSVAFEIRAHAGFGGTDTELARVRWTAAGGSVAARWDVRVRTWSFGLGPGFSLDALELSPDVKVSGASGRAVSGPWGGPELDLLGSVTLGSAVLVYARFDAGVLTFPVHGDASDGRRLADASGGWLAAALGVGAAL
jgi:hypothetical protein